VVLSKEGFRDGGERLTVLGPHQPHPPEAVDPVKRDWVLTSK
jgi:hypothetical protein